MVNRILFIYKLFRKKVNNFSYHSCILDAKKDYAFLLRNPKLVYAISQENSHNSKKELVKDIIMTTIGEVEQESLITFSNKLDKKNKTNSRIDNNLDIKKNKIKSRKKTRSQINLNNDDIFINDTNFTSQNTDNQDPLHLSLIKPTKLNKNKKKYKIKKDILDSHNNRTEVFNSNNLSQDIDNKIVSKEIFLHHPLTIQQLSDKLSVPEAGIITWLFLQGISVTINQVVDFSIANKVAKHYDFNLIDSSKHEESDKINSSMNLNIIESDQNIHRAPIITIFGHVDHGKTTLLDAIRQTNLVKSEVGGITQSITGYEVHIPYLSAIQKLIFLDTPGHEAFTGMRLRGVEVTDLALIVVAADDGLQTQSLEAIKHVLTRNIPYIIAINKIDKEDINIIKIREQLSNHNILDKQFGGNSNIIEVSALTGYNIKLLLSALCDLYKSQNLQANPQSFAQGTILEAYLDKKTGPVANLIIQDGTLHVGDIIVSGNIYGRVKILFNSFNTKIDQAEPSTLVQMWGFSSIPQTGLKFYGVRDEKNAKLLINENLNYKQNYSASQLLNTRVTLDSYNNILNLKIVNIILKTNTQGAIEAIINSFSKIPQEKVQINILAANSGSISNKDIELAMTSGSIIIGFDISTNANIRNIADKSGVKISVFNIIYRLLDYIKDYMLTLVEPAYDKIPIGTAIVKTVFNINKGTVAGCLVNTGKLKKNANISVYRNKDLVYSGLISSLKRIKDDVNEVIIGNECGVMCCDYNLWNSNDMIEVYELVEQIKVL